MGFPHWSWWIQHKPKKDQEKTPQHTSCCLLWSPLSLKGDLVSAPLGNCAFCSLWLIRIKQGHHLTFVCARTLEPMTLKCTWDMGLWYRKIRYKKVCLLIFSGTTVLQPLPYYYTQFYDNFLYISTLWLLKECRMWLSVIEAVWNLV